MTSGLDQHLVAILGIAGHGNKRVTSTPSMISHPPDIEEGLSVFVSVDLNFGKDAPAFATHGEAHAAQASRKGCTEVSTKQLNSEGMSASREENQPKCNIGFVTLSSRRHRRREYPPEILCGCPGC